DINTRELLAMVLRSLRVVVLVDYNPDGAQIYQVYAQGGWSNSKFSLPHARWAGLHCSMTRIGKWGLDIGRMIEFTYRDRSVALRLLKCWAGNKELRRRMAKMLYRGKKAELEAVTQYRGMVLDYIHSILLNS
ncbi:hypothetical protein EV174_004691, partial [Coemansia sp. RSA 2320]